MFELRTAITWNGIGSSRVMVLSLSENANSAPHVQREIAHTLYTKRRKPFPRAHRPGKLLITKGESLFICTLGS